MGTLVSILGSAAYWALLWSARALIVAKSPLSARMIEDGLNDGLRFAVVFGPLVWFWVARQGGAGATV